ncbi:lasso peptide biosynthesis B2 protein [Aquabacter sp. CN5-332]|uniref:lasso peptide biosynthesis B2 protein n=1 Tax=Aquabacter sp. CN5-332 TaxID=3156608 RepID=UPI0032B38C1B
MRARLQAVETLLALALGWLLVFVLPFRVLAKLLGHAGPSENSQGQGASSTHLGIARGLGWRIERLAPRFPGRATCLVRAVAGWLLLRRRGISSVVRFGVRRHEGVLEAHAWIRVGETTVLGGEEAQTFAPIADLGGWAGAGGRWRR